MLKFVYYSHGNSLKNQEKITILVPIKTISRYDRLLSFLKKYMYKNIHELAVLKEIRTIYAH